MGSESLAGDQFPAALDVAATDEDWRKPANFLAEEEAKLAFIKEFYIDKNFKIIIIFNFYKIYLNYFIKLLL